MRLTHSLRIAVPALLGIALTALPLAARASTVPHTSAPVASAPDVQIAGLYNLTLIGQQSHGEQRVDLILQQTDNGVTGLLLSQTNATALTEIQFDGETLKAVALTSAGRGQLVIHFTESAMTGTLSVGKHVISVKGERAQ
jgi:hypothetical protein